MINQNKHWCWPQSRTIQHVEEETESCRRRAGTSPHVPSSCPGTPAHSSVLFSGRNLDKVMRERERCLCFCPETITFFHLHKNIGIEGPSIISKMISTELISVGCVPNWVSSSNWENCFTSTENRPLLFPLFLSLMCCRFGSFLHPPKCYTCQALDLRTQQEPQRLVLCWLF